MPLMVSMWVTTVCQSMAIFSAGRPSRAILPPWFMLATISWSALARPDISRPTSNPSARPSSRWASRMRVAETSIAASAPMLRASSRRSAETSVMAM